MNKHSYVCMYNLQKRNKVVKFKLPIQSHGILFFEISKKFVLYFNIIKSQLLEIQSDTNKIPSVKYNH